MDSSIKQVLYQIWSIENVCSLSLESLHSDGRDAVIASDFSEIILLRICVCVEAGLCGRESFRN